MQLHDKLVSAAVAYDKRCERQELKRRIPVNIYRIAHILKAIDATVSAVARGADIRAALCERFNDRLLDAMLKAAGLPKASRGELHGFGAGS